MKAASSFVLSAKYRDQPISIEILQSSYLMPELNQWFYMVVSIVYQQKSADNSTCFTTQHGSPTTLESRLTGIPREAEGEMISQAYGGERSLTK